MGYEGLSAFEIYKSARDEIEQIYRSRLLTEILLFLGESNKTLSQLREITGSSSQAIIPKIRRLESMHLLERQNNEYKLTPLGKVITSKMGDFSRALGSTKRHGNFWVNHHIEGIPAALLNEIGDLFNSEIISDTTVEVLNVYRNYADVVNEARYIYGISSIISQGHVDILQKRVTDGIPVELVVSREVAMQLKGDQYSSKINILADCKNLKLMVTDENFKAGMIATDRCFSFGLYKRDGAIPDTAINIISRDKKAIEWGRRLFEYYKQRAVILDI